MREAAAGVGVFVAGALAGMALLAALGAALVWAAARLSREGEG